MHHNSRRIGALRTYDPRTKLHILLMYLIMCLVSWKIFPVLICALMGGILIYITRENLHKVASNAIGLLILELVIGVIVIVAAPVRIGLYFTLKLYLYTIVSLLIVSGMKQAELLDGLAEGFGLRAKTARMLMLILDYLPKLYREKKRGRLAQRARGVDPESGNILDQFRKEILLTIPNLKYAFARSKSQYEAMNKKQYVSVIKRNSVVEMKLTWVDKVAACGFMFLMLSSIVLMLLV